MGRFQREAEVLASLDHPNIGQIYGIEEAGQTKALVLQLIEGQLYFFFIKYSTRSLSAMGADASIVNVSRNSRSNPCWV